MSSAKRPPLHRIIVLLGPLVEKIFIPEDSVKLRASLINKLNNIGDRGQPCLTPLLILKEFDEMPSQEAQAEDVR